MPTPARPHQHPPHRRRDPSSDPSSPSGGDGDNAETDAQTVASNHKAIPDVGHRGRGHCVGGADVAVPVLPLRDAVPTLATVERGAVGLRRRREGVRMVQRLQSNSTGVQFTSGCQEM